MLRSLRRAVRWHRRLVSAALAAAAVAFALAALSPAPPPSVAVLAAARDLSGGIPLRPDDFTAVQLPPDAAPDRALRPGDEVAGRVLAAPMRAREPLTDTRIVGAPLITGYGEGLVAAPVRVADAAAVALLRPGDAVDVLAAETSAASDPTGQSAGPARVVADGVRVVAVPAPGDNGGGPAGADDALVVLAVSRATAMELARAAVNSRVSVTLLG